MTRYTPSRIEKRWQKRWAAEKLYHASDSVAGKRNHLLLVEFPYPSGDLHMGHWYAFALPDMQARYRRMRGDNVMYPIGFDAFGLPAENAAIKRDLHPGDWTKANIKTMTKQLASMGAMFDWSRMVSTIDPAYYRWTQWMFLQMVKRDLAYRATTRVNWCPKDKTVLANEQVADGRCDRCGTQVVQRDLEQWMMRTTAYADRLVDDSEGLDWPRTTRLAQQNWIGRSEGARIRWELKVPGQADGAHYLETFTTRADTLYGVTFLVISPEVAHRWMDAGWQPSAQVKNYVSRALGKRELDRMEGGKEKTGEATGVHAINPLTRELVPVWVADYVLGSYGTGAIMAVPAHDQRDFEFARTFSLPILQVIAPSDGAPWDQSKALEAEGVLVNSGPHSGKPCERATRDIIAELKRLKAGGAERTYKLRDWVISRQRYWGVPIPMIHCASCGWLPVPEDQLPVKLPKLKDYLPADDGHGPLAKVPSFVKTKCPQCKGPARRETDTMDTFVDSSWYYLRYADSKNDKRFAGAEKLKAWLPVPMYIGGAEHNTMHLLYSRFFTKVLYDLGHIDFNEPFTARRNHGIILGPDSQKMSKSRGNVVNPDAEVARYGADTVRMYLAFMAPYEQGGPWDPKGINGVARFLSRVWALYQRPADATPNADVERALQHATKKIGEDLDRLSLNTCVSELMKTINVIDEHESTLTTVQRERLALLLAPLAPHIAEELWRTVMGHTESVHVQSWPSVNEALLKLATVAVPVQVNGKVRGVIELAADTPEQGAVFAARQDANVAKHLAQGAVRKIIYVPGRMLNIVVG
jgi:leucyl-tRNA synthetase